MKGVKFYTPTCGLLAQVFSSLGLISLICGQIDYIRRVSTPIRHNCWVHICLNIINTPRARTCILSGCCYHIIMIRPTISFLNDSAKRSWSTPYELAFNTSATIFNSGLAVPRWRPKVIWPLATGFNRSNSALGWRTKQKITRPLDSAKIKYKSAPYQGHFSWSIRLFEQRASNFGEFEPGVAESTKYILVI